MTGQLVGTVGGSVHRDLEVVAQDATIVDAAVRMRERSIGSVLVGSVEPSGAGHSILGIVTELDLVRKVIAQGLHASQTTVAEIMARPLLTIGPDQPLLDANQLMETNHVRHLCVSEGGSIVGVISVRDLVMYFVDAEAGPVRELDDVYRPLGVLMRSSIETIDHGETLQAAARRMAEKHIGSLLVSHSGKLVGIVTETDLVRNEDWGAFTRRDLRELNRPRPTALDTRPSPGRPHVLHPIGTLPKHRDEIVLALICGDDKNGCINATATPVIRLQREQHSWSKAKTGYPRVHTAQQSADASRAPSPVEKAQVTRSFSRIFA